MHNLGPFDKKMIKKMITKMHISEQKFAEFSVLTVAFFSLSLQVSTSFSHSVVRVHKVDPCVCDGFQFVQTAQKSLTNLRNTVLFSPFYSLLWPNPGLLYTHAASDPRSDWLHLDQLRPLWPLSSRGLTAICLPRVRLAAATVKQSVSPAWGVRKARRIRERPPFSPLRCNVLVYS